jgi:hypothetical protein
MNLFSPAKMFPTEDAAMEYRINARWLTGVRCVRRYSERGATRAPAMRRSGALIRSEDK